MREFLKGLELDKETIDSIMAEHGKLITEAKENANELKNKITDYESKIKELTETSKNNKEIQKELDALKEEMATKKAEEEAQKQDRILNDNILSAIKDKKFVNEYTKNSIVSEIKSALKSDENLGKSAKDIFEELTKDKEGLFDNPNKVVNMGDNKPVNDEITKEAFSKMPYSKRIELKQENPTLFEKLNSND